MTGLPNVATFGNQKVANKIIIEVFSETPFALDNPAKNLLQKPKETKFMVSQCHFHVFYNSPKVFSFLDIFKNVQFQETRYNIRLKHEVV